MKKRVCNFESGCCEYDFYSPEEAHECTEGCMAGTCDSKECATAGPVVCEQHDTNPCTVSDCNPATGVCGPEEPVSGDLSDACSQGVFCENGQLKDDQKKMTEFNLSECEGQAPPPFGCVLGFACKDVEGVGVCDSLLRDEGSPCWLEQGQGQSSVCIGHSCTAAGECTADIQINEECSPANYPDECTDSCIECTELICDWVVNDDKPGQKMKHCHPKAKIGQSAECDDQDLCTLNDACKLDPDKPTKVSQYGFKENFGVCTGEQKTKEQCAEEKGYEPKPCVLQGLGACCA